jgi:hypothetical protein
VKRKSFQVSFYSCRLLHFQIGKSHCSRKSIIMNFFFISGKPFVTHWLLLVQQNKEKKEIWIRERERERARENSERKTFSLTCRCLPVDWCPSREKKKKCKENYDCFFFSSEQYRKKKRKGKEIREYRQQKSSSAFVTFIRLSIIPEHSLVIFSQYWSQIN